MSIIIISAIAATTAAVIISRKVRVGRIAGRLPAEQDSGLSCLIPVCRPIVDKALECLSSLDDLAVCRNHRRGVETLEAVRRQIGEGAEDGRCEDLLTATEMIAGTSRRIVTAPYCRIPMSYKSEIETIRAGLDRVLQSAGRMLGTGEDCHGLAGEIAAERDFLKHAIAVRSVGMSHDDFDDDDLSFPYLMLLQYLNSFLSTLSFLIKNTLPNYKQAV